jgi:hypothetical protein
LADAPSAPITVPPTDGGVHRVQGANAGHPAFTLDVLQQGPIQVLPFPPG